MKTNAYALCALLAFTGAALAAPAAPAAKTTTAPAKPAASTAMKARGEVVSVDAVGNTLTIKGKKGEATFAVAAAAKIMNGKKEIKLADITAGENVSVSYMKEGAVMTASRIRVIPSKPAPADAAKK